MLKGKKIVIGVTASIAAYKIPLLIRELVKAGAEVQVVVTPAAFDFVTPLTLSTVSKRPVLSKFVSNENGQWNSHVELGLWADLILFAPLSANTMAKMASGICDNLLLAVYLSARSKVMFAPAMDLDMYQHPTTKININKLQSFGNILIPPGTGDLASGLSGEGRMEEPEIIFNSIVDFFRVEKSLVNKKILVTAGPTYEAIDPVRYIGNHSSGKMGISIADKLADRGAEVTLVCGPSSIANKNKSIKRIDVVSADEMFTACIEHFKYQNAAILSAAVADYRPKKRSSEKLKKKDGIDAIEVVLNKDILATLGELKSEQQILVGFALETDNEYEYAKEKLKKKNLDFIVLNKFGEQGVGFEFDTNKVSIIESNNNLTDFELKSKEEVAVDVVNLLHTYLKAKSPLERNVKTLL